MIWLNLLGGLGVLLYGMRMTSGAVQALAGDRLRQTIGRISERRLDALGTGLLVSLIVQSSAITTVMVVSFVNAGLMTLVQGASVILGANVGGTVTVWLLALRLQQIVPLLLGAGALLTLFARRETVKFSGELGFGLGLMFFALGLLEAGFAMLLLDPVIAPGALHLGADRWHVLLAAVLGALLTTVVRSASGMVGVTMAAATVGLIDFAGGAALVLGANVGTTISAQLAASDATAD
ncbi:MAG: Na/Pi symporter, partial [Myxococcota bacterium]